MSAISQKNWTPESYLEFERASGQKHEYFNGEIFAMAGATANHNLVAGNTYAALYSQLRRRAFFIYFINMRLKMSVFSLYTYPDISIVCGTPQFEDDHRDKLLNPTVIIEVLSPSTESYDRGRKFQHYRTLASLQEYILMAQDKPHIEHYLRQEQNQWLLSEARQLEAAITLPSIQCTLLLSDVYEKVDMSDPQ